MGRKMKLPFLSNNGSSSAAKSSWPWPSCHQPRTLSFRTTREAMFKTLNSAYLDVAFEAETPDSSWFTNSSDTASLSTASDELGAGDPVENVIRGLRSERLFFEPGETSSILDEAKAHGLPFKESVLLSMESQDPYVDFKQSMEEMVEAHGLKDWEGLEELLCWYLRVNGKSNHGYIVGAFVDLLVGLSLNASSSSSSSSSHACAATSCSCSRDSPSSPLSFYTSSDDSSATPRVSSLEAEEEIGNSHCLTSLSEGENEARDKDEDDGVSAS